MLTGAAAAAPMSAKGAGSGSCHGPGCRLPSRAIPSRCNLPMESVNRCAGRSPGERSTGASMRLGCWISCVPRTSRGTSERFHRWQNPPRVAEFWQEDGSLGTSRAFAPARGGSYALGLIGCLTMSPSPISRPTAKEDRIAPFYVAEDYDRGIHMLVGERPTGAAQGACWLSALVHYLFLDDPRSQRVVAEPRRG